MGYAFPLQFKFKVTTIANDFVAIDSNNSTVAYVRQKMFKLIEHIDVYSDESRSQLKYTIKANKWLDFSATYSFADAQQIEIGRVARKGWKSLWKVHYEIFDERGEQQYSIREDNPWVKVADSFVSEVPIVNFFTGYLFHPSYTVADMSGNAIFRLKKEGSFWGRRFSVSKLIEGEAKEEMEVILSLMMMILLERRRG